MPSKYYNHETWPSPVAKIVVKNLELDVLPGGIKIKRITHDQALDILTKRANKNRVEEFLSMKRENAWKAIGATFNPLYKKDRKYY